MIALHVLPLVASLGPIAVGFAERRPRLAVVGLVVFDIGYLGILIQPNNGANSPWHLGWLAGMAILSLGLIPRPTVGSWWEGRFGQESMTPAIWAAVPVTAFVLAFVLQLLHPLILLPLVAAAVLGPIVGAVGGWVTKSPRWREHAVMSGAISLVFVSVVVAYVPVLSCSVSDMTRRRTSPGTFRSGNESLAD